MDTWTWRKIHTNNERTSKAHTERPEPRFKPETNCFHPIDSNKMICQAAKSVKASTSPRVKNKAELNGK